MAEGKQKIEAEKLKEKMQALTDEELDIVTGGRRNDEAYEPKIKPSEKMSSNMNSKLHLGNH